MSARKGAAHQNDGGAAQVGSDPSLPAGSGIAEQLAPLVGLEIRGGCDDCDAHQTVNQQHDHWVITVAHDDHCPTWARIRRGRGGGA